MLFLVVSEERATVGRPVMKHAITTVWSGGNIAENLRLVAGLAIRGIARLMKRRHVRRVVIDLKTVL